MSKIKSPIKQDKIADDKVLQALNQYDNDATPEQKESDLMKLEKECRSTVDAYDYVNGAAKQFSKSCMVKSAENSHRCSMPAPEIKLKEKLAENF